MCVLCVFLCSFLRAIFIQNIQKKQVKVLTLFTSTASPLIITTFITKYRNTSPSLSSRGRQLCSFSRWFDRNDSRSRTAIGCWRIPRLISNADFCAVSFSRRARPRLISRRSKLGCFFGQSENRAFEARLVPFFGRLVSRFGRRMGTCLPMYRFPFATRVRF